MMQPLKSLKTNQQILELAIEKAIAGGWSKDAAQGYLLQMDMIFSIPGVTDKVACQIIYNHDFAKALWGEEIYYYSDDMDGIPMFKYKLSQMVIADDAIAYLGQNI